jgi:hypothetical protein
MGSSSSKPSDRIDLNFEVVIAFDYYDGPESGLALYASGEGIRFSSVGDSESRLWRGFEMDAIEGDWWPPIRELIRQEGISEPRRVIVPGPSETLMRLRDNVTRAVAKRQFVGVGTPDLSRMSGVPVREAELSKLRELGCSTAGFKFANGLVRGRRQPKRHTE